MSPETSSDELRRRLDEVDEAGLVRFVKRHLDSLDVTVLRQLLRHPFLSAEVIQLLLDDSPLASSYELRRELAGHPRTPEARALQLVTSLYWRDLMRLGAEARARPTVRRAADRRLGERLPGLASGEKVAIARRCGAGLLPRLAEDPNPRVFAALLDNPRLTEGLLLRLLSRESLRPEILALVARSRRWGLRYRTKLPICRHPNTPVAVSLGLLPGLKKQDLKLISGDPRLPRAVRRRADLLLGKLA